MTKTPSSTPWICVPALAAFSLGFAGVARATSTPRAPTSAPIAQRPASALALDEQLALVLSSTSAGAEAPWTASNQAEAFRALREAGLSQDASYVPVLKRIATACSESAQQLFACEALDALWRLGVPPEYFELLAGDFATRPMLAQYAMLTLGREPSALRTAAFEAIARQAEAWGLAESANFGWATSRARAVVEARAALALRSSVSAQLGLLARDAIGGYSPFVGAGIGLESPTDRSDPKVAWSRAQLEQLALRAPAEVAQALLTTRFDGMLEGAGIASAEALERLLNGYRDWVSAFLPSESLALYRQSRPRAAATER